MVNYLKAISSKIMMQVEHFYALYMFTVLESNGGVATTTPPTCQLQMKIYMYPNPGEGPYIVYTPIFASKWPQRMPGQLLKINLSKNRAF